VTVAKVAVFVSQQDAQKVSGLIGAGRMTSRQCGYETQSERQLLSQHTIIKLS
jgi:hypothetical protein